VLEVMRAGKDYIAKDAPEHEDARAKYLRELLQAVNPVDVVDPVAPEESLAPRAVNQNKPKLTLR
jgi:hypothetical protein